MKIKEFKVLNDDIHEYTILTEDMSTGMFYQLKASNNAIWSNDTKNKILMSIHDNGNGLEIEGKIFNDFDYSKAQELRILLNFISINDKDFGPKFKIIKEELIGEV